MNIKTEFEAIVNSLSSPAPAFLYANLPRAVQLLDQITGSTVLLTEIQEGNLNATMTATRAIWNIELSFIELVATSEIEAVDRYTSIEKAILNAQKFVEAYNATKEFDLLQGDIEMKRIPENFCNAPITGVVLNFECKPTDYICS